LPSTASTGSLFLRSVHAAAPFPHSRGLTILKSKSTVGESNGPWGAMCAASADVIEAVRSAIGTGRVRVAKEGEFRVV
jgi:hypothetical protein